MTTTAHDLLAECIEKTFADDNARSTVLVIGAGLHHHLKAEFGGPNPSLTEWTPFTDWNGLLSSVASDLGLPIVQHEDPAATWESLVVRYSWSRRELDASAAEREALRALARRLDTHPLPSLTLSPLVRALSQFRDVITLNVDSTLGRAIRAAGAEVTSKLVAGEDEPTLHRTTWNLDQKGDRRLWYPHGSVQDPDTIVLGVKKYGRNLQALITAWNRAKNAERIWRERQGFGTGSWTPKRARQWWAARRAAEPFAPDGLPLTWFDVILGADLVFIGVNFDRAETDLWWALNARMRNLARVKPSERPLTLLVQQKGQLPPHLHTSPAGVTPVLFESYKEAWNFVIGPIQGRWTRSSP